jgi:hypothetical protein
MDEKQRREYEEALASAGIKPRVADREPQEMVIDGPLVWAHRVGVSLMENFGIPFYGYNTLEGVHWDCERCGGKKTLSLCYRKNSYSLRCQKCSYKRNYNHLLVGELLARIAAPLTP